MNFKTSALAAAFLVASLGAASANVTMVNCTDYTLTIADDVVVAGQAKAGSARQFEINACNLAEQLGMDNFDGPKRVSVRIEGLDMDTVVVVIPNTNEK